MKYFFTFLILFSFLSCDKKQEKKNEVQDSKPSLSVVNEYSKVKFVDLSFKKDIEDWKELKLVNDFLGRFKTVSPNEVLSNAIELKNLTKSLVDSVKPKLFDIPSFHARINIFYNETLRLADMTSIPAIKANEVNNQTEKIIDAFSAVNSKINTVLSKKRFEEEIGLDIAFIGLDSTKMDSISKKTVSQKLQERVERDRSPDKKMIKPKSSKKAKFKDQ